MVITKENYESKKEYVKGMFSLGGLSECGKTSAGLYMDHIGVKRLKIIQIEKEMMEERGYDLSLGMKEYHFDELYQENRDEVFREFLYRLIIKLQAEGVKYASIESLYRAELGVFLKKELGARMINIFIDAPLKVRAEREYQKINERAAREDGAIVRLEEIIQRTSQKDAFKIRHGADRVKNIADIIIKNDSFITKIEFDSMVGGIASILLKRR